jgi:transmembrane sensor
VRHWLESNPHGAREFDDVAAAWNKLDLVGDSPQVAHTLDRYRQENAPASGRWPSARGPLAASALAASILVGVALAVTMTGQGKQPQVYQTRPAELSVAVLTDGSTMHLNALSEVQVDYSKAARHVVLVDGEATFRVEHDVSRPFVVVASGVSVRAVGTEFNVRREGTSITVSVLEGLVEVAGSMNSAIDKPVWRQELPHGRVLTVNQSTSAVAVELDTSQFARIKGWQNGRLSFHNEPLQSVVDAINRNINNGRIVIADEQLRDLPVNMNFDVNQAKNFVSALLLGFPVQAEYLKNGEIRLHYKHFERPQA